MHCRGFAESLSTPTTSTMANHLPRCARHGEWWFFGIPRCGGQERDIITITLTCSNPQGEIGFFSEIRRMNVGMTRAQRMRWAYRLASVMATVSSHLHKP
jgi:hypothetical protein